MEDYPRSLVEFQKRFATEYECQKYLAKLRWPEGFVCPYCGGRNAWVTKKSINICYNCRNRTSITSGTIFHRTRKPLTLWFNAMWHLTSQKYGANALGLQRVLGLGSYHTAWEWLHRLRRAMVRPGRDKLFGIVEIDETFIGGERAGKRGRGAENKALVVIAVEDREEMGFGRIRLSQVPDASSSSLTPFVIDNVVPASTVRTDNWSGYNHLSRCGYDHIRARDSAVVGDDQLPLAHRIASLLKRWLLGTYQGAVQPTHLDYYLDEYTFRFNRRTSASRGKLFYRLAQQAMMIDPIHGGELKSSDSKNATLRASCEYLEDDVEF